MKYPSLAKLMEELKSSPRVRGIFVTGTTASGLSPSSDIDLVVILDENKEKIRSVYTTVEGHFSDIFFFDVDFLKQLQDKGNILANDFDGMFVEWLAKGKIEHDPEGFLLALKDKISENSFVQNITESEKKSLWAKINYNFIANKRYYDSGNELYRKALELRLLHSVIEIFIAYFSFRNIPWRGEKEAVKYLEQNDQEFLLVFNNYSKSNTIEDKIKHYEELFAHSFFGDHQKWPDDFVIAISKENQYNQELKNFWDKLLGHRTN